MVDEVGFTVLLCTLNLFPPISLSPAGLPHFLHLVEDGWQGVGGRDLDLLLRGEAGQIGKSEGRGIEGGGDKKLLSGIRVGVVGVIQPLHVLVGEAASH